MAVPAPTPEAEWFGVRLSAEELRSRAIGGISTTALARIAAQLIRFASITLLARILVPADFGLIITIVAILGLVDALKDFGLSSATIRFSTLTPAQTSNLFWFNIAVSLTMVGVILTSAPLLSRFFAEPRLGSVAVVMALSMVLNAAGLQHRALLNRAMRFDLVNRLAVVATLTNGLASLAGAWAGLGYWALVLGIVAGDIAGTVLAWHYCSWRPQRPRRRVGTRPLAAFGLRMFVFSVMGYLATNLHTLIITRLWGISTTGLYGRAWSTQTIFLDWVLDVPKHVMSSAMARLVSDPVRQAAYFYRGCTLAVIAAIPIQFLCLALPHELIGILFGPRWDASAELMRLLAIGIVAQVICHSSGWVYMSVGSAHLMMRWGLIGWSAMIAATLIGAQFSAEGIALATSVTMILLTWPCMSYAFRGTALTWNKLAYHLRGPLACGLVAGLAAWSFLLVIEDTAPWLRLVAGCTVFAALDLTLLAAIGGQRELLSATLAALSRRRSESSST